MTENIFKKTKKQLEVSMKEEWRDIKGHEGCYQVSSMGRVKSFDTYRKGKNGSKRRCLSRILKPLNANGYQKVALYTKKSNKHFLIHRLVAKTFINNNKNKPCVNHIDGIKTNNTVSNLEWCTYSENSKHAKDTGLWKPLMGSKNGKSKLDEDEVVKIKGLLQSVIAAVYGVNPRCISDIKTGRTWKNIDE